MLNVGGGAPASLDEAIAVLSELSGGRLDLRRQPQPPGDVRHTAADIGAARDRLGYEPKVDLRTGLEAQWTSSCAANPATLCTYPVGS